MFKLSNVLIGFVGTYLGESSCSKLKIGIKLYQKKYNYGKFSLFLTDFLAITFSESMSVIQFRIQINLVPQSKPTLEALTPTLTVVCFETHELVSWKSFSYEKSFLKETNTDRKCSNT